MRPQPVQQSAIALRGGLKLLSREVPADAVDDCGLVQVGVVCRSRPPPLSRLLPCCCLLPFQRVSVGGHEPVGQTNKTVMGPFGRAPMKSQMPDRPRAKWHRPRGQRFP